MGQIAEEMDAIAVAEPGGPEQMQLVRLPVPEPSPEEILVRVEAAGVNRGDTLQRMGFYPPPPGAPETMGLEFAGRVVKTGASVTRWSVGDPIMALVAGGGYAEYALVHQDHALPVPASLSMTEAGAVPETFFTVWTNIFDRGRLASGETLLVHGGSSGIGTTAIPLARAFGARVLATAGSAEKCKACEDLGAEHAINYRDEDFVAVTKELTGGKGADVILDMVGGAYLARNLDAAAIDGRIVLIACQQGTKAEIDLLSLMIKRVYLTGSTLRPRSVEEKAQIADALRENVMPLLEDGKLKPVIDSTFPLSEASEAHKRMEEGSHIGKIVLTA